MKNIEIEFTTDVEIFKKGEKRSFSPSIARALVNEGRAVYASDKKPTKKEPKEEK
jgi:hypothetical protein